jgi:rhodanese-related sulfurtransferase
MKNYKYNIFLKIPIFIALTIFLVGSLLICGCKSIDAKGDVIQISVEKVYKIINEKKDYFILDVRTKEEFDSGHLESAMLIPLDELESRLSELPKDKPIIVYCRSGRRSTQASEILIKNHFSPVYNMTGGIEQWIEKKYPVSSE